MKAGDGSIERDGNVYRLRGAVTMANVEALLEQGRRLFEGPEIVVDLGSVGEVDSSAVSLLLQWLRDAQASGRRLVLVDLNPSIHSLAVLYGVTELLPLDTTRTGAAA